VSEKLRSNLLKYGITIGIGLLMAYAFIALRDLSSEALVDKYRILCDAFTVPGMLLLLSGCLLSLSNAGALDGVGYLFSQAAGMLIPGKGLGTERYSDYLERKRGKRLKGYGFLYISAAVFMLAAMVFMILFYVEFNK